MCWRDTMAGKRPQSSDGDVLVGNKAELVSVLKAMVMFCWGAERGCQASSKRR